MATYKQLGDVEVEAFQWRGDNPAMALPMPGWTNGFAFHTPTDNTLHVPTGGINAAGFTDASAQVAHMNDWVVRSPDGTISVMTDSQFALYFDVEQGNIDALKAQKEAEQNQDKMREDEFVKATTPSKGDGVSQEAKDSAKASKTTPQVAPRA